MKKKQCLKTKKQRAKWGGVKAEPQLPQGAGPSSLALSFNQLTSGQ
jgi:hypothetical protein